MWATIKDSLFEHIDGLMSQWGAKDKKVVNTDRPSGKDEQNDGKEISDNKRQNEGL